MLFRSIRMVAIVSVSSVNLDPECHSVIRVMQKLNLVGDVTPNVTVAGGDIEHGCRILIAGGDARGKTKRLWKALKAEVPSLQCAHITIQENLSGCVFDVFGTSQCPTPVQ